MTEYTEPHFRDYYIGGRSEYDPDYTDDMEAMRTWNAYIARVRRDAWQEGMLAGDCAAYNGHTTPPNPYEESP